MDEEANAEFSEFIADKIRSRVHDPVVAEKLIPKDHGFGVQRVPMETGYYEAYNRDNVHLVDLQETPIERITPTGIRTTEREYEFDVIVYATGFDAVTGAYDRIDIRGVGGQTLRDKWADGPVTFLGMQRRRLPEHAHADRPAERLGVDELPAWHRARRRLGDRAAAAHVEARLHPRGGHRRRPRPSGAPTSPSCTRSCCMRKAQGWFTGYNSNVEGHEQGTIRYLVYNGGTPKYRQQIAEVADEGYRGVTFD